jgi:glycogen(starch) synthase
VRGSDVIHIAGPSLAPLVLGFLARKPLVVEHHGYQAICPNGILIYQPDGTLCPGHFQARRYWECWRCQNCQVPRHRSVLSLLLTLLRSWLVRRAAKNLAITRHVLERHNLPRAEIVYYGIEDPASRRHSGISAKNGPERVSFAFVGRFVPEKGIPTLLQAARQLMAEGQTFEVRLIGDGPERSGIEGIVGRDKLQNHVRITGYLTGAALVDALRDVRVVVMPSVWEETAGLAAIEQMMRGRLVIASDIGGLAEVVGDTGLRFAPGNAAALAECMRRVLHEPTLVEAMGREARRRALDLFARPRMIDEHRRVYQEALESAER